jgi:ferrous iron transport protein B
METDLIQIRKQYIVAKISGRWGLRRRIHSAKITAFKKIEILKELSRNRYLIRIEGIKSNKKIPKYYFNYIHLIPTNEQNMLYKAEDIYHNINISVFRSTEVLNIDIFSEGNKVEHNEFRFSYSFLPSVTGIYGNDYNRKKLRNTVLTEMPDIFVGILDAENLENDLFLATQFIDMDAKLVLVIKNIKDKESINFNLLSSMTGVPVIAYNEEDDPGHDKLKSKILDTIIKTHNDTYPNVRHIHINFGRVIENSISRIIKHLKKNKASDFSISPRFSAISLLEKDTVIINHHKKCNNCNNKKCFADKEIAKLESLYDDNIEVIFANARRAFVKGALAEVQEDANGRNPVTKKLDKVLTHRIWGIPMFLLFMFIMFFTTFELGKYPMEWLEILIDKLSTFAENNINSQFWNDLIVHGALGGIGGVLVFLPNIFILFFFIGILENSGYMSRAAFVMDKYMHKIGLHGKSFIPMIMGFGCTVPAIMSTRILENKRDRILTMMILPFFSCSARLPVYILLISAFFPEYPLLILIAIYGIGIFIALITSKLFSKTILKQNDAPYIMELRPYIRPTLKMSLYYMWNRSKEFVKKIGGIILIGSIIIWALGYYPKEVDFSKDYNALISQAETEEEAIQLRFEKQAEHHAKSYIGRIGHFIEPVMSPLGFDWKMSVGILSGIAGKEITVSTMGVLYQASADDESYSLQEKLKSEVYISGPRAGENVFNKIVAASFLLFVLIYFPCIAVISTIWKESQRISWAIFSAVYTTLLAWLVSFATYQIGMYFWY